MSFEIIMTTSVTRSCFTKQHQNCKTKTKTAVCKTKTDFLVSDPSCPKTDGLRPHHCFTGRRTRNNLLCGSTVGKAKSGMAHSDCG